ncbi:MAG: YcxB family protein [Lachnospiraceae bacterium]
MTAKYKVVTKHTKEALEDFVKFTCRIKSPKATYRFCVIAGGFLLLAMFLKDRPVGMIGCGGVGLAILLFAFTRHKIGLRKLMKTDDNYKNQSEMEFIFGQSGFTVANPRGGEAVSYKYGDIVQSFKDNKNYYISVNDELFLLPYRDFKLGNNLDFAEFIHGKTGKIMILTKLTWKQKLENFNLARDVVNEEHEKKMAAKKENKKED